MKRLLLGTVIVKTRHHLPIATLGILGLPFFSLQRHFLFFSLGLTCFTSAIFCQEMPVLDLTGPNSVEPNSGRVPGMKMEVTEGLPPTPTPYALPLESVIQSITPSSINLHDKFVIQIKFTNIGKAPFELPISRDYRKVEEDVNRGRRTFDFILNFTVAGRNEKHVVEVTAGSESIPDSFFRLGPGQSIIVKFIGYLLQFATVLADGNIKQINVESICSEWTLEDDRYFIKNHSEEVRSKNYMTLHIQP
jgi:hypothetical protein